MAAFRVRLLADPPARGARNMAVDHALMESAGRTGIVTLRLYRWEPGCLSFGRNQEARGRYDGERAAALGYDVVRRPTGGRSVLHHRELTYSVTAPADWGSLREAYLRINRALAVGLRRLGAPAAVHEGDGGPAPRPTVRACFRDPLPGEVTAGGRKLVGSAQWRDAGALLQHGSILLRNEQDVVERLRVDGPPPADVPAAGLAELLGREPDATELERALAAGFAEVLEAELVPAAPAPEEEERACALQPRYEDRAWTWRL
ncbi:MAG: octanoyltransferase [Gemmatimonadota bacterium]|nr:octanoyltransferase [Gemmatimonadota bacterium]